MNGRINIANQFDLFDKIPVEITATPYTNATRGIYEESDLSRSFFSKENISYLQRTMILNVKLLTDYTIPPQNEDTLKGAMWGVYMDFAAHIPNKIGYQIDALNKKVLEQCVPGILEAIKADIKYRYDISHMHTPIAHSISTSNKGLQNNEFKTFF
tara:strand:- start:573 stop:1040 length:468 start_codon:yes stop_codon:yes gene_type:complete